MPVVSGAKRSSAKRPRAIVPIAPQTPWTEMAPTGSSTRTRSKKRIEPTTSRPAARPIRAADHGATNAHGAVIATRPARTPLSVMLMSAFLNNAHDSTIAPTAPQTAARLVVRAMWAMSGVAAMVEPGLNPNQPSQRMKTPSEAIGIEWPGIGLTFPFLENLPILGPTKIAPIRASQAPVECTTVEPAKSHMPRLASQPPPQIQWPTTG